MKKIMTMMLTSFLFVSTSVMAQPKPVPYAEKLQYFLPDGQWKYTLDSAIPTPEKHFGFQVGQQMAMYDQIVTYMYQLAQASPRMSVKEYGRTHENRPILCVAITSPENQAKLEDIRVAHQNMRDPMNGAPSKDMPAVVEIMGSIHGNEASGVNSTIPFAYFWAAAQGQEIEELLKHTVILLVPAQNPDGCTRFASWANSHRSLRNNTDPQSLEFHEASPGGRSNHYWHDLNRDWINATQPEIQALLKIYHAWMPNLINDHHEQSRDAFFFLEPADPVGYYPQIPQENKDLTEKVAEYETAMLDQVGSLYFSKDSYDSYSLGTGDVYPDALGSVAMLFEQPSSRGHQQESANGVLNFPFTVRNQVLCAYGAVKAANGMREELNDYMYRFVKDRYAEAQKQPVKGWVFDGAGSKATSYHFVELLHNHGLQVNHLAKDYTQDGYTYKKEDSFFVPAAQQHSMLLNSLFETNKEFKDSLFYDISTWNLAEAYGLNYAPLKATTGLQGDDAANLTFPKGSVNGGKSRVAYVFDNKELYAPYVVNMLQEKGIRVMAAGLGATSKDPKAVKHGPGTLVVPVAGQKVSADSIYLYMKEYAEAAGVEVESVQSSRMADFDLGHYRNHVLRQPKIAILNGGSVGTAWFTMNYRMQLTPSIVEASAGLNLSRYNVIVMPGGVSNAALQQKLAAWVQQGGTLITIGSAFRSTNSMKLTDIKTKNLEKPDSATYVNWAERADKNDMYTIPGTDLKAQMDYTHPLCWGYQTPMPVMKASTQVFEMPKIVNNAPVWFDKKDPQLSGYLRAKHRESLKGAPEVIVTRAGSGNIISFSDDPNFRSVWYAGTRMFMNAIFFGNLF
ncbi:MAG: M14 family metallopeptidase [Bacteroidales bacterium]|nr:M14 family metallopeptidase [Bacteroidales bacterium]